MDPDTLLERIRELATELLSSHKPGCLAWDLANAISTLDTQMSGNGAMPFNWLLCPSEYRHRTSKTIQERLDSNG